MKHGSNELGQVQPDVRDVDSHVISHLEDLLKPEETKDIKLKMCSKTKSLK